jgi:hypothetical protein
VSGAGVLWVALKQGLLDEAPAGENDCHEVEASAENHTLQMENSTKRFTTYFTATYTKCGERDQHGAENADE